MLQENCLEAMKEPAQITFGLRQCHRHECAPSESLYFLSAYVAGSVGKFRGDGPDGSRVLPAGRSAADHSQQHGPCARLWKTPLQFQQVSCYWPKPCRWFLRVRSPEGAHRRLSIPRGRMFVWSGILATPIKPKCNCKIHVSRSHLWSGGECCE